MRSVFVLITICQLMSHRVIVAMDETTPKCNGCSTCRSHECCLKNGWTTIETVNFTIWSRLPKSDTQQLACACESLRKSLVERWFHEDEQPPDWREKCHVVVHADLNQYQRVIECGRNPSVGCATITADNGRVLFRRIDLRADAANWSSNALPHELTHVVLADLFPDQQLPAWLNEGLAMIAESPELKQRRLDVLKAAHTKKVLPGLGHILSADIIGRRDTDLFYAASLSLTDFLLQQEGGVKSAVRFAERASIEGHSSALRDTYSIEGGLVELEKRWLLATIQTRDTTDLALRRTVGRVMSLTN